jgi:hypothetical protein
VGAGPKASRTWSSFLWTRGTTAVYGVGYHTGLTTACFFSQTPLSSDTASLTTAKGVGYHTGLTTACFFIQTPPSSDTASLTTAKGVGYHTGQTTAGLFHTGTSNHQTQL